MSNLIETKKWHPLGDRKDKILQHTSVVPEKYSILLPFLLAAHNKNLKDIFQWLVALSYSIKHVFVFCNFSDKNFILPLKIFSNGQSCRKLECVERKVHQWIKDVQIMILLQESITLWLKVHYLICQEENRPKNLARKQFWRHRHHH